MLGTQAATVLTILTAILAGALGVAIGGVTCAVLRRPWGTKAAGIDAVLAMTALLITAMVIMELHLGLNKLPSGVVFTCLVAACSIAFNIRPPRHAAPAAAPPQGFA